MATKPIELGNLVGTKDISVFYKNFLVTPKSDDKYFGLIDHKSSFWSNITLQGASSNQAAGVISADSSVPVMSRPSVKTVSGQMLEFGAGMEKSASDIKEFMELKAAFAASNSAGDGQALIQAYGDDLLKVRSFIQNEKCYLNWSLISNACNIDITLANSTYAKSMSTSGYPVSAWQKDEVATAWSNTASLILDDILGIVEAGKAKQKKYSFMFVNPTTYSYIRKNKQIQDNCASRISVVLGTTSMPSQETINLMLKEVAGVSLIVIEDQIDRANAYGIYTTAYAFNDNVAVFTESEQLGHFGYNKLPIIDTNLEVAEGWFTVGSVMRVDPNVAKTYSRAEGFSVIDSYASNFYLKTDAVAW